MLVAATDDLKEQVGGVGVVGQVADLVNARELRTRVGAQPPFERARGVLAVRSRSRSEAVMKSAEWPARTAWWTQILGEHGLAEALGGDQDDILALGDEVEREDALDGRPMDLLRPGPFEIGHRFEAAEARRLQPAFDARRARASSSACDEGVEQDDRTPALLRRARDEIIEVGRRYG